MILSPPICNSMSGVADVIVRWTAPSDTGGVDVEYYVDVVNVTGSADTLNDVSCSPNGECNMVDDTTTTISNLECGITYTVKVRAFHCLNGTFSADLNITVPPPASECYMEVMLVVQILFNVFFCTF